MTSLLCILQKGRWGSFSWSLMHTQTKHVWGLARCACLPAAHCPPLSDSWPAHQVSWGPLFSSDKHSPPGLFRLRTDHQAHDTSFWGTLLRGPTRGPSGAQWSPTCHGGSACSVHRARSHVLTVNIAARLDTAVLLKRSTTLLLSLRFLQSCFFCTLPSAPSPRFRNESNHAFFWQTKMKTPQVLCYYYLKF